MSGIVHIFQYSSQYDLKMTALLKYTGCMFNFGAGWDNEYKLQVF